MPPKSNPPAVAGDATPRTMPAEPANMPAAAVAVWKETAPTLYALGVLSQLDGPTLETYCRAVARYRKAEAKVAETDDVVAVNGEPKPNPWRTVADKAAAEVHKLALSLGLCPGAPIRRR